MRKMVRFAELKAARIVDNRMTLGRWIDTMGFPKPVALGANSIAWLEDEVVEWLARRKAEREVREATRKAKGAALAQARAARRKSKSAEAA